MSAIIGKSIGDIIRMGQIASTGARAGMSSNSITD